MDNGKVILWVLVGVAVLSALGYGPLAPTVQGWIHPTPAATATTGTTTQPGAPANLAPTGCAQNPTLGTSGTDTLVTGTAVGVTPTYIVNGKVVGSSYTPVVGDKVTAVGSNSSGYLPDVEGPVTIACGAQNIPFSMTKYANATVSIYNDAGTGVLSNSANNGSTNESAATGTKNWKVHFVSPTQKSTSDIFFVTELPSSSSANVSSLSMSCNSVSLTPVAIPSYVSSSNTNSFRNAWVIPALTNGVVEDCYLQMSLLGGKTLTGVVYNTAYAEKSFINDDGTIAKGIYSQLGTAKYQDSYSYNFGMN